MSITTAQAIAPIVTERDRADLRAIAGASVRFDESLAPYTSWKIGGPADAWIVVESERQLAEIMRFVLRRRRPWFVLGSGSNILIGDGGVRGIVMQLAGDFAEITVEKRQKIETLNDGMPTEGAPNESEIVVQAGASANMALLTAKAASAGALGIGSLAGIPGSVGGSLRMNAGTDREMGDFVREVWVQSPGKPEPHSVSLQYFYRHTTLAPDAIVSRVTLAFECGEPHAVREEMQTRLVRRKQTQPIALPNAGSCFRNPEGDKAARLIEAAGAKGWREGNAEVSPQHANFINNLGGATAKDVAALLARVRRAVQEQFGVELQLEVHLVGVFI